MASPFLSLRPVKLEATVNTDRTIETWVEEKRQKADEMIRQLNDPAMTDFSETSRPLTVLADRPRQAERSAEYARNIALASAYITVYWLLDWVSFLFAPEKIYITPWNPPVAATAILLLTKNWKWAPVAFVANLSFNVLALGRPLDKQALAISLSEMTIYTLASWALKDRFKITASLGNLRDSILFCGVMTGAAAAMGIVYVLIFLSTGAITRPEVPLLAAQYGVGDALAILIMAPLVLTNYQRPSRALQALVTFHAIVESTLIVGLVISVCFAYTKDIRALYLLFVPVLWMAINYGSTGAAAGLGLIQISFLISARYFALPESVVTEFFPFFMLCLAWTGIATGSLIFERESSRVLIMKGNARLKALLDMTPECMLIVDFANSIVAVNQHFAGLFGAMADELIGRKIVEIMPTFAHTLNGEASIFLKDDTIIPVEVSTSKVTFGDKYSSILTVRDITNKKQAEVMLRQRRAVSEQASRTYLTGSLAAVLAHELNQPLSAIMSYTSACKNSLSGPDVTSTKAIEQLDKISVQAKRAGDIIRRLRDFFQNSSIDIGPIEILPFVRETLGLLEDEITETNTAIDVRILEVLIGAADRVQLEQVFINLIRNSLEALRGVPADQRKIRIVACRSMRGDIEFIIHDTGPGIASEIANQLFNPFVTTRLSGMGLGLTISRSIIEGHNGRLWAELQSSSGAAMHFTIPVYEK